MRNDFFDRPAMARERVPLAHAMLANCHFCAHHCGVNRLEGQQGVCRAGARARFFSGQIEAGDELELVPTYAVALSGCDLRCVFCISAESSWNARAGADFEPKAAARKAVQALAGGAKTIMLLGGEPAIHLPAALEFVAELPASARLVWKTNAHCSPQARDLLESLFDVWVADFKFGNDRCARELAGIEGYLETLCANLAWAGAHSDLIIRHLLMPGHVDCCWRPIAQWVAAELPRAKVSLRAGFWPLLRSARHPNLCRTLSTRECDIAYGIADEFALHLIE